MPRNNSTSRDSLHQFRQLKPTKEKNREEKGTATREGTFSIRWLTIEQRSDNETVRNNNEELCIQSRLIAPSKPEFTLRASQNLSNERHGIRGSFRHYSRLVCPFIRRPRTEEDETQFGKPNTAKSRKRDKERGWIPVFDFASWTVCLNSLASAWSVSVSIFSYDSTS
jgi:hypothetical protein